MHYAKTATAIVGITLSLGAPAIAGEQPWKDGRFFVRENVATLAQYQAVKITFGLQPGICTPELTAVSEWLKVTEGEFTQTYTGKGEVKRATGEEWYQEKGTKVVVCNKGTSNAVLIGMQFRPEAPKP